MRDVIQVDNRAQLRCQGIFLFRRIVGGKHNLLALGADESAQSISSVSEEQSQPQPYSRKMSTKNGFGVALIAKYSRNPGFQENASFTLFAFSRIPFSS